MIMQINWISEYIIMYLNRPNEVTKAQRPSSAKCFMQVIFSSFDVNGAATDASAYLFVILVLKSIRRKKERNVYENRASLYV